jgi:catechol 2,3-dioxygenase-like lactoylglutathione lyase family enzyme
MNQSLFQIALVVKDYDEAIDFYVNKLHFDLLEDTKISYSKRWVIVKPKGENSCSLLLAKAKNEQEIFHIGNQTGGRVFLFLYTDDILRDYKNLQAEKIKVLRLPHEESFGKVLVFEDLYGNLWDLIEQH